MLWARHSTPDLSLWWPTKDIEKKGGFFSCARLWVALPTGNHKLFVHFCFSWMLIVKATETHSEHKKMGQSAVVRVHPHRLKLDHKLQSTLEINTAPGIKSSSHGCLMVFFLCFLISQHISALSPFYIISCLCFIKVSNPLWPTMASAAPVLPQAVSLLTI